VRAILHRLILVLKTSLWASGATDLSPVGLRPLATSRGQEPRGLLLSIRLGRNTEMSI
jgi:hypothetical protein